MSGCLSIQSTRSSIAPRMDVRFTCSPMRNIVLPPPPRQNHGVRTGSLPSGVHVQSAAPPAHARPRFELSPFALEVGENAPVLDYVANGGRLHRKILSVRHREKDDVVLTVKRVRGELDPVLHPRFLRLRQRIVD